MIGTKCKSYSAIDVEKPIDLKLFNLHDTTIAFESNRKMTYHVLTEWAMSSFRYQAHNRLFYANCTQWFALETHHKLLASLRTKKLYFNFVLLLAVQSLLKIANPIALSSFFKSIILNKLFYVKDCNDNLYNIKTLPSWPWLTIMKIICIQLSAKTWFPLTPWWTEKCCVLFLDMLDMYNYFEMYLRVLLNTHYYTKRSSTLWFLYGSSRHKRKSGFYR